MLRIVEVILELIRDVAPIEASIRRRDAELARQLRDALNSAALNAAEGSDQRGGRRGNHYCIALGSAREAFVAMRVAEAWGFVGPLPEEVREAMNRVIGTLVKVTR
jgi:four helix bundle protein